MDSLLPEIASAMSEVQIGTLFRFAEMAPAAAAALVIAVLRGGRRPGSLRCGRARTAATVHGRFGRDDASNFNPSFRFSMTHTSELAETSGRPVNASVRPSG